MHPSNSTSLNVENLYKTFETENQPVEVLRGVSLTMQAGEASAILGPSGSGKSTLLHIIGTLDSPTSGKVLINNQNPFLFSEPELAKFRNESIGFIFQDHHLLPQYTVRENVLIPTLAFHKSTHEFESRAKQMLERVGLSHRLSHRPAALSGGERQRVAIARALINRPNMLLCDEPTGNLDHATADAVATLLFDLHKEEQNILIVVTHNLELAKRFNKRFVLAEGAIRSQE
ncbi:MAG: ABC transporter ATP-binding protein [bacterium]